MSTAVSVHLIVAGGHAKVVLQTLTELGCRVEAVFDDNSDLWEHYLLGAPIVGPTDRILTEAPLPAVIAVGTNAVRQKLANRLRRDWLTVVHPRAVVDPTARLGAGCVVLAGAVVQVGARLGDHVIVNTSASVDHDCIVGDFAHLAPGARLAGGVSLGDGVLLGIGAVAIPGTTIGPWTTVGAGAAVVRDLPGGIVAVGVPARVKENPSGGRRRNAG